MLLIELLIFAHVVIHIDNKGYICGNIKDCNFETSKNSWNQHFVYLEGKAHVTTKSPFTLNIFLRSMNEWLRLLMFKQ